MYTERRRLLIVALGVVAVALGAGLFPSAGVGSAPSLDAGSGPSAGGSSGTGPAGDAPGAATPTSTPTARPTDADPTPQIVADSGDGTPTPTPTDDESDPVADDTDDRDESKMLFTLLLIGIPVLFVGSIVALRTGRFFRTSGRWSGRMGLGDGDGDGSGTAPSLSEIVKRIPQATMVALVGVSTLTARVLGRIGAAGRAVESLFRAAGSGTGSLFGAALAGFARAFRNPPSLGFGAALAGIPGALASLSVGGTDSRPATQRTDGRAASPVEPTAGEEPEDEPPRSVTDAWEELTDAVPVRDPDSRTPGEYARAAVAKGLPAAPVRRLTRVFRRVQYGDVPPSDDDTETAVEAALRIRREATDDGNKDGTGSSTDTGEGDDE